MTGNYATILCPLMAIIHIRPIQSCKEMKMENLFMFVAKKWKIVLSFGRVSKEIK